MKFKIKTIPNIGYVLKSKIVPNEKWKIQLYNNSKATIFPSIEEVEKKIEELRYEI